LDLLGGFRAGLFEEVFVGGGDGVWVAVHGDFAFFDEDGASAIFADVAHAVGDEDDGLVALEGSEIFVTLLLEGGVADGEDFVEQENIAFGANGDGEGEADLHAGGVIFELLVHKFAEFGKINDVVIHGFHFGV